MARYRLERDLMANEGILCLLNQFQRLGYTKEVLDGLWDDRIKSMQIIV